MRGPIASSWAVKDGVFTLDITLPANTTATVCVPAANAAAVQESGKPAAEAEGVKLLRTESGEAVFEVQSGVYRFTAPFGVR
jgi:alpha-L-rhamnosidase